MIKLRLQGTKNDLKSFIKILERCSKVNILSLSDFYNITESKKYYKIFIDLKRNTEK